MKIEGMRVWNEARQMVRDIVALSPELVGLGLADQIRRAAISVVSNMAEGAGRVSDREIVRFLVIARASNAEVQAQLAIASDCRIAIDPALIDRADHVRRMLSALINRLVGSG